MADLVSIVHSYSKKINDGRHIIDVFDHMMGETYELVDEITGYGDGIDGVVGESIDVILCALDIIFLEKPDMTAEELREFICEYAEKKCKKWESKATSLPENNS